MIAELPFESQLHSNSESERLRMSGRQSTPSPLKSMTELIRQNQAELKLLTPDFLNAQANAELAS